jgi:hypothetical protein
MASTLPINIPIPAENILANYDWTDVADGTGYIRLYVIHEDTLGDGDCSLVTKAYSTPRGNLSKPSAKAIDLTPFNTPRTIGGRAVVNCGKIETSSGNGSFTVTFWKVSGGAETAISGNLTSYSKSSGGSHIAIGSITQTNFKVGDILRIKLTGNGTNTIVHCDPTSATDFFLLDVPFKIQL